MNSSIGPCSSDCSTSSLQLGRASIIFHLFVMGLGLCIVIVFPHFTADDAFILFRYADNLANHGQLTWNIGEPTIEGYTGCLLPAILSGLIEMGFDPVTCSHFIGTLAMFVAGGLIGLLLAEMGCSFLARALVTILFFTAPINIVHALSGLETMVFSCSLIASAYCLHETCLSAGRGNFKSYWSCSLLTVLFIMTLIRPEGCAAAGIFILATFCSMGSAGEGRRLFSIRVAAIFGLPSLLYLAWKYSYYGQFLPLPYYVKRYVGQGPINPATVGNLVLWFIVYCSIPLAATGICLLAKKRQSSLGRPSTAPSWQAMRMTFVPLAVFCVVLASVYLRSNLQMNFTFRFWVPFYAVFLMAAAVLWDRLLTSTQTMKHSPWVGLRNGVTGITLLFAVGVQVGIFAYLLPKEAHCYAAYKDIVDQGQTAGKLLRRWFSPTDTLIVHIDAGAAPFWSRMRTVDFGGLNDKYLAMERPSTEEIVEYFYSQNAVALLLTSYDPETLDLRGHNAISADKRFERYRLVRVFKSPLGGLVAFSYRHLRYVTTPYCYFLYLRNDVLIDDTKAQELTHPGPGT
jgi:hypothetical protein